MYIYIYMHVYVCVYVCVYIYIYMYRDIYCLRLTGKRFGVEFLGLGLRVTTGSDSHVTSIVE